MFDRGLIVEKYSIQPPTRLRGVVIVGQPLHRARALNN
jgi:hypothetical protein